MWQPGGFYNEYVLRTPVILSGKESIRGLYNYPAARIAVIHGGSFFDKETFISAFPKKELAFIRRSWDSEPDFDGIAGTLGELEKICPDMIIAVGGGSVIDGSKLCRLFYEFPYFQPGETRIEGGQMKTSFVAVPTTVGSGAEVSSAAVFVDRENHKKDMIVIHELQPDVVVYDERYVEGSSLRLLASSVMDAMSHILEGYVSNIDNHLMEIMAEKGFSVLVDEIRKAINKESDDINYQRLQYAGCIGGLVQNHCIVGAAHAVAHQLSEYGFSHGEAVALLLTAVILQNAEDEITKKRYLRIMSFSGFEEISDFVSLISDFCNVSGINNRKQEVIRVLQGLAGKPRFLENAMKDRGGQGNPVPITEEYIRKMIIKLDTM